MRFERKFLIMRLKNTLIALFLFPCFAFGQVDFSFTVGGNLSNFTAKESDLLYENEVYLIPKEGFKELGTTVGFKIQRSLTNPVTGKK